MSDQSRYFKTHRKRLPRKKRSKEMYGSFEDTGRYIQCWNCGFYIDTEKTNIGGDYSGNISIDFPVESVSYQEGVRSVINKLQMPSFITIVMAKLDADGVTDLPTYTPRLAVAYRGCPFCGTENLP